MSTNGLSAPLAARQYRGIIEDATNNLGASRGPHLSIRGGRFRLIDATGNEHLLETHYVDIIVVDANKNSSRVYFEGEFDPASDIPPTCFSDNGVGPSTQSMSPQSPTCAACPHNIRGSDLTFTGKPTTACSNRRKLAFILHDDPSVTVYEFQIPPGSLGGLRAYGDWLKQQASGVANRPMDINDVVTRVSFDPEKQFVMVFQPIAFADDERTIQLVQYIYENKLADVAVGRNDVAHDPENVKRLLAASPMATQAQISPASPAPQGAQQFQLPPRGPIAGAAQSAPKAPKVPKGHGGRSAADALNPSPAAAQATPPTLPPVQNDGGIPAFLRRAPAAVGPGAAGAPPMPPQRNGVGGAPPPPPGLSEALGKAMSLPTRRA
jgi:hypothetical protein